MLNWRNIVTLQLYFVCKCYNVKTKKIKKNNNLRIYAIVGYAKCIVEIKENNKFKISEQIIKKVSRKRHFGKSTARIICSNVHCLEYYYNILLFLSFILTWSVGENHLFAFQLFFFKFSVSSSNCNGQKKKLFIIQ